MSRPRPSRSGKADPGRRADHGAPPASAAACWTKSILLTGLALLLGVIAYAQLTSLHSMAGAMSRTELQALGAKRLPDGRTLWQQTYLNYYESIKGDPRTRSETALGRLLQDVARLNSPKFQVDAERVREGLALDADNPLARLAAAALLDAAAESESPANSQPAATKPSGPRADAMERFKRMRGAVHFPPTHSPTLYNDFLERAAVQALRERVARADVLRDIASFYPNGFYSGQMPVARIEIQFLALPTLFRRLDDLAGDLRRKGHKAEADEIGDWIRRTLLGLIETDRDYGTRLLCVEWLVRELPAESDAASDLRRLRQTFHAHAEAAPADWTDQAPGSYRPAVDPGAYRWAFVTLAASVALLVMMAGAVFVFGAAGIAAVIGRLAGIRRPVGETRARRSVVVTGSIAAEVGLLTAGVIALHLRGGELPSELWGRAAAAWCGGVGILGAIALATRACPWNAQTRSRFYILLGICLAALVLGCMDSAIVTPVLRGFGGPRPASIVLGLLVAVAMMTALFVTPARMRDVARAAALFLLVNASLAIVVTLIHRAADRRHQTAVDTGRADEFAARLGSDWAERYLASTRRLIETGGTATTRPVGEAP